MPNQVRRLFWYFFVGFCVLILVSCQPTPKEVEPTPNSCSHIDEALRIAAEITGDPMPEKNPNCSVHSPESFLDIAHKVLRHELSEEDMRQEEHLLKVIGLIPHSFDYTRCLSMAYTRELSAFYSPHLQEIVLPDWYPIPKRVLVHEVTHYLQDEMIDIEGIEGIEGFFGDKALTIGAILEGDARKIEEQYVKSTEMKREELPPHARLSVPDSDCILPESLHFVFAFQYAYGFRFWRKMDELAPDLKREEILHNLPSRTTDILLPERYVNNPNERDELSSCESDDEAFRKRYGQFVLQAILNRFLLPKEARESTNDWKDDCLTLQDGEVNWELTFRTEQGTNKFLDAIHRIRKREKRFLEGEIGRSGNVITFRSQP